MPSPQMFRNVGGMAHTEHTHNHGHGHGHGHDYSHQDSPEFADLLDLDGKVLHDYLATVTSWVREHATASDTHRILDLGAGTGTGTIALAETYPDADVFAVDVSEALLTRVRAKASHGLSGRVHTIRADLNQTWPAVDPVDLVWSSAALHEISDPDRLFATIHADIRPGGVLAVIEMADSPLFLPDEIGFGTAGLESRWTDILVESYAEWKTFPDWTTHLTRAGFDIIEQRTFAIDPTPPTPADAGRYALAYLSRLRPLLEKRLNTQDLASFDILLNIDDPRGLVNRTDLVVRGRRTAWMARRP